MKTANVIVCGGRDYNDRDRVFSVLDALVRVLRLRGSTLRVVAGGARGADALAVVWAKERGVPFREVLAEWSKHGKRAGFLRNQRMLDEERPEMVVAFPGGRGTEDMVRRADAARVEVRRIPPAAHKGHGCFPLGINGRPIG